MCEEEKMSVGGTFLIVITASFLKPLLGNNQSAQLPIVAAKDQNSNTLLFDEAEVDVPNIFLTLSLPHFLANTKDSNLDTKRQFGPWGGKRHSTTPIKDENIGRKRQFSPWGGKRSLLKRVQFSEDDFGGADAQLPDVYSLGNKRNFNSWGGKRSFNSWGGKRNFNSWGGKRNFKPEVRKKFKAWGGKINSIDAWIGKRCAMDLNKNLDILLNFIPEVNKVTENKKQGFNLRGEGAFNSWGGKRAFSSWGGKRFPELDQESRELVVPEENSNPETNKDTIEGTETSIL